MSKSPHRFRGDAAECWRAILFGEIVRTLDQPIIVRADPTVRLPRTGRWESGLAQVRPALDDVLGATAFAVAWRWACAERDANAWPGLALIAAKATDRPVSTTDLTCLARSTDGSEIVAAEGDRRWSLLLPDGTESVIGVRSRALLAWSEVDRTAAIVAAWLSGEWHRESSSLVQHLSQQ